MKFLFETMRFLSKYIALNQQIIYLMTFHTYFTAFQTYAPRRITHKISQIANSPQFGLFFSQNWPSFVLLRTAQRGAADFLDLGGKLKKYDKRTT